MCDAVDFFSIAVQFDFHHCRVERHVVRNHCIAHCVAFVETVECQHDGYAFSNACFFGNAGYFGDYFGKVDGWVYIEIVLSLYRTRLQIIHDETELDDVWHFRRKV